MMEINSKTARRLSIIGERPAFGTALFELAQQNEKIIAVVADVVGSAGLERMKASLPDQVINVGIAEQNMMGIATGLSSEGFSVVTTTFAPFQAMRCLEQIRVNQGYMQQKVIMVGLASGVAYGELGWTHCCLEDAALLSMIPNIQVVTPADCIEVVKVLEAAMNSPNSVYIRLMDKTNVPMVYTEDYEFTIGKAVPIQEGSRIAVLSCGPMVFCAKKAVERIHEETGEMVSLYDFHTLKPVDVETLELLRNTHDTIITVEEHNIIGGIGTAVSDYYARYCKHPRIVKMGIQDEYCHGASHEAILQHYSLTEDGIYKEIIKAMEESR